MTGWSGDCRAIVPCHGSPSRSVGRRAASANSAAPAVRPRPGGCSAPRPMSCTADQDGGSPIRPDRSHVLERPIWPDSALRPATFGPATPVRGPAVPRRPVFGSSRGPLGGRRLRFVLPRRTAVNFRRLPRSSGLPPSRAIDALTGRRKLDAVAVVLILLPAGAEPEDQPAAAGVVDGDGLDGVDRGTQRRVKRSVARSGRPAR